MSAVNLAEGLKKEIYVLRGLNCSSCALKIERAVNDLPFVQEAVLNFAVGKITVLAREEKIMGMTDRIQDISDKIEPGVEVFLLDNNFSIINNKRRERVVNKGLNAENLSRQDIANKGITDRFNRMFTDKVRLLTGAIIFILALSFKLSGLSHILPPGMELVLFFSSYLIVGGPVIYRSLINIKNGSIFDENFLMTVATIGAFAIGEYPEGVAVMLFYMIGEMFQNRAVDHSRRSIEELMDIRPDYANLKKGKQVERVAPEEVNVGDEIIVRPGGKVPLDGKVTSGNAMLDASALTGESALRSVKTGDRILSGMINKDGLITIRVNKKYSESTVARILHLVENAAAHKAPTEEFISKLARYYTPIVVYGALAVAIIPPLVLPGALFADWLYRALIFLVISCPCALVVSIPLSFFGGIGRASKQGILVKGGNYLEALYQAEKIVFDKTGTLTRGIFKVDTIKTYNGYKEDEVLKFAAVAESNSNHPIAISILNEYNIDITREDIENYQELSGRGIRVIYEGQEFLVGNIQLLQENNIAYDDYDLTKNIGTVVYVAVNQILAGYITIKDEIKADAFLAIDELRKLGIKELIMLTGDRKSAAKEVADKIGIDTYFAELLPEDKVKKVEELLGHNTSGGKIVFVGDGINDAPVLARSDIGVAMGGLGSDAAIEAADIVLMTDEPSKLVTAIKTARITKSIVWQNIILASGIKGIVLMMGVFGVATMWEAVFADVGVALLAVINSMRVLNSK